MTDDPATTRAARFAASFGEAANEVRVVARPGYGMGVVLVMIVIAAVSFVCGWLVGWGVEVMTR
jgi:hypothetical protein